MLMSLIALFAMSFDIKRETQELTPIDIGITQGDSICDIVSPMEACGVDNQIIERCGCLTLFSTSDLVTKSKIEGYSFKIAGTEVICNCVNCDNYSIAKDFDKMIVPCIRGHDHSTKA